MDFIFDDEKTMYDLVGGIGVEAVKGGLAGLLAYTAAALVGTILTTVAVVPLMVMAVAAVGFGVLINQADKKYDIKGQVIAALKVLPANTAQGLYSIKTSAESWQDELKKAAQQKANEIGRAVDSGLKDWLCPITCRRY